MLIDKPSAIKPKTPASELNLRVRNGDVAWSHVEAEFLDVVDDILETLVPEEPYAYTMTPKGVEGAEPGAIPYQRFASTAAELRSAYEDLHRVSLVRRMQPVAEMRGDWYVFLHGLGEGLIKGRDMVVHSPTAVLFPTMGKEGITGELFWTRSAIGDFYTAGNEGPLASETAVLARHDLLLAALRAGDAEAATALFHPNAQTGVRNYVEDDGTLAGLHSADELRTYLTAFFDRYTVLDIGLVQRLATQWFVFAELFWVVEDREQGGRRFTFSTAEHAEVRPDGLFASRIGHGTDLDAA